MITIDFYWYQVMSFAVVMWWPITLIFLVFSAATFLTKAEGSSISRGNWFAGIWGLFLCTLLVGMVFSEQGISPFESTGKWEHFVEELLDVMGIGISAYILFSALYFVVKHRKSGVGTFVRKVTILQSAIFLGWFLFLCLKQLSGPD
jgi:hypothetical protein